MSKNRIKQLSVGALAGLVVLCTFAQPSKAEATSYEKVYRVEVEYWYWPPDIYYWSTFLETTNEFDAEFALLALELARDHGYLDSVVPSNNLHIPVDVRLTVTYKPIPQLKLTDPAILKKPQYSGPGIGIWD